MNENHVRQDIQRPLSRSQILFLVSMLLVSLLAVVVINRAWVSDDSYITFRVVDNLNHGYGLRWNVNERAQVFTHPLWMLCIAFLNRFTKEVYLTSIFFSLILTIITGYLFWHLERKNTGIWLGLVLLASSSAFVDYSTSGLENPLSHFLTILFLMLYSQFWKNSEKSILPMTLVSGLLCLNRLDYLLLFIPFYLYILASRKEHFLMVRQILVGFLPLIVWLGFAAIYYGFPLPNTFYAKLGSWLPREDLLIQGWAYCKHTLFNDPITGLAIVSGIVLSIIRPNRERTLIAIGAFLYLFYIVWIGGDFMEGRFFTVIFLIFVYQLIHFDLAKVPVRYYAGILLGLLALNFLSTIPTIASSSWSYIETWENGIVNERFFYANETALLRDGKFNLAPAHPWMYEGDVMRRACVAQNNCYFANYSVGFSGYFAGPDVHIIDQYGLASALMARISPEISPDWRIGHFPRKIPTGYFDYLRTGDIYHVPNDKLQNFIIDLEVVTNGKIFTRNRIRKIIDFWIGVNQYPLD
jgi:arabinofuranosyltransferase